MDTNADDRTAEGEGPSRWLKKWRPGERTSLITQNRPVMIT